MVQMSIAARTTPVPEANALFVESDCTSSCGKVAQPTTSIGEMASDMNLAPRRTDRNALDHEAVELRARAGIRSTLGRSFQADMRDQLIIRDYLDHQYASVRQKKHPPL